MNRNLHLHFVGVGGIGMSGIAEVFLNQGYRISGSDLADGENTRRLRELGAEIFVGHRAEQIGDAQVVVISSAVKADNPEVVAARTRRIPVIPRAEMLAELMRGRTGIAIAGTHGKTTTTSMVATILTYAGLDPTLVIGGKVDTLGGNAKLGRGTLLVAEADESDGSFLHLPATYGVITNIDNDHLDHFGTMGALDEAFVQFVAKLPFYGCVAVCTADEGVRRILPRLIKPFTTYGWTDADFTAREVRVVAGGNQFEVWGTSSAGASATCLGEVLLRVPGKHNVLNALGSIAISMRLGVSFDKAAAALALFGGVKRRFEIRYRDTARNLMIVDDYGHHPTEVRATLEAARAAWTGRIVTLFQPHRYSRTLHCHDGFLDAFGDADVVLLADIYAAGEAPIDGVSSELLALAMQKRARSGQEIAAVGAALEAGAQAMLSRVCDGDLLLCLGAGTITRVPEILIRGLSHG